MGLVTISCKSGSHELTNHPRTTPNALPLAKGRRAGARAASRRAKVSGTSSFVRNEPDARVAMCLGDDDACADVPRPAPRSSAPRMRALRARKKAQEVAPHPDPLSGEILTIDARTFGPHPNEYCPGWEATPVARVHQEGLAVVLNILDENDVFEIRSKAPEPKDMEGLFGKNLWTTDYITSAATSRRLMASCEHAESPWRELEARIRGVLERLHLVGKSHVCSGVSLLLSLPGAPQQSFHTDFKPHELFKRTRLHDACLPYPISVLFALQDGATLTLPDGRQISIPKYAACVFRGDLRHAGSAYKEKNLRMHVYYGVDRGTRMTRCLVPRRGTKRKGGAQLEVVRADPSDP